jgi:para-nitrobenzyl esterase
MAERFRRWQQFGAVAGLFGVLALLGASPEATMTATVRDGAVRGAVSNGVASFLGIPYAAPPVGNLRWRPPVNPAPWSGVRDATSYGNECAQSGIGAFFPAPSNTEDCLYLNVFTNGDVTRRERRPVMFWIFGGGFYGGSTNDYDMTALVKSGAVVVSVNYRLGLFGFFAHPALDAEQHDLGDYGMMDQQLALRWVRRNIAAFGGDPDNVTIFGESAGAQSVLAHIVSPASVNLFQRAIVESAGTPALLSTLTPLATAEERGRRFATAAGCANQTLACLRALSAEQIVAATQRPLLDGLIGDVATIPKPYRTLFESGAFNRVPLIMGSNHDEWRWPIAQAELNTGEPLAADAYPAAVAAYYGPDVAPAVLGEYPLTSYGTPSEALGTAETDYYIACSSYKLDQWMSPYVPVFAYQFDDRTVPMYMAPVSFPYGAAHTSELQFLFPGFHGGRGVVRPLSPAERQLAAQMTGYWTTFAKRGDPNGGGRPAWPRFNRASARMLSLRTPAPVLDGTFVAEHHCDFWNRMSQY